MIGNKIDPSIYTVYKGKKVYFCCETCKSAFGKNPGSYLARLPQFAPATVADVGEGADRAHADHVFSLAPLIKPTGILTLSLVGITVALGVLRRLKPRLLLKWHKIFGVAALISGAAHGAMVLVIH